MSKLEPTLTYSNLTATERLRAMLDERGVEWKAWDGVHLITVWHDKTYLYEFVEYRLVNGAKQVSDCPSDNDGHCELTIKVFNCTPEQAIAATLGRKEYVYALTAIDPEDGREYMLGIYATRELAEKSIETNGRGYTLHYVSRWEVVGE